MNINNIQTIEDLKDYLLDNFEDELRYNDFQPILNKIEEIRYFNERKYITIIHLLRDLFEDKLQINPLEHLDRIPPFYYIDSTATSTTIPNGVKEIGDKAFYSCESLTSVTMPNSVKRIDEDAFYQCTSLTSINIPSSVTEIGKGAFEKCKSLKTITISNGVKEIGNGAFSSCTSLTSINIPSSVTKIDEGAFWGCTSLTSITLPKIFKRRSLRKIGIDPDQTKVTFI